MKEYKARGIIRSLSVGLALLLPTAAMAQQKKAVNTAKDKAATTAAPVPGQSANAGQAFEAVQGRIDQRAVCRGQRRRGAHGPDGEACDRAPHDGPRWCADMLESEGARGREAVEVRRVHDRGERVPGGRTGRAHRLRGVVSEQL